VYVVLNCVVVLCCVVLCCAVLCCAVLCCAVLCCAELCCVCYAMLWYAMLCYQLHLRNKLIQFPVVLYKCGSLDNSFYYCFFSFISYSFLSKFETYLWHFT
jgi:hypothetical protein